MLQEVGDGGGGGKTPEVGIVEPAVPAFVDHVEKFDGSERIETCPPEIVIDTK
jgi:hypothetical protein